MENSREHIAQKKITGILFRRVENSHPYYLILFLSEVIITLYFLYFLYDLTMHRIHSSPVIEITLPRIFFAGGITLLISIWIVTAINKKFQQENLPAIKKILTALIIEFVVFQIIQFRGLLMLSGGSEKLPIYFKRDILVLMLSHSVCLLAVTFYLLVKLFFLTGIKSDPVKELIYFTSEREKLNLNLIKYSWRFSAYLWLFCYVYLLMLF